MNGPLLSSGRPDTVSNPHFHWLQSLPAFDAEKALETATRFYEAFVNKNLRQDKAPVAFGSSELVAVAREVSPCLRALYLGKPKTRARLAPWRRAVKQQGASSN